MNLFAKKFADTFNQAAKKSSRANLFDDFLKIAATALNRDEKTFHEVSNKDLHCTLFSLLAAAIDYSISAKTLHDKSLNINYIVDRTSGDAAPRYRDILGEIYHALDLFEQSGGQVFTPQHTADLMGVLAISPTFAEDEIKRRGFVSIKENCCGSGALIFGGLNALLALKINPCRRVFVQATDLDPRCVLMTFIQLSLYGIPAVVSRQDAATDELHDEPLYTPIFKHWRKLYGQKI